MENYILKLEQLQVSYPFEAAQELLMIGGGRAPDINWFNHLKHTNLICIDCGIDFCFKNNLLPNFLIGDLDSADKAAVQWAEANGVQIEKYPVDKDFTDTQLALLHSNHLEKFVILTGAFGGRFDHLYSTVFSCAHSDMHICLADEREIILFVHGGEKLQIDFLIQPKSLSLLPMSSSCEGVSIDGVQWSLDNASLFQAKPYAISNRIVAPTLLVSLLTGSLAVYCSFAFS